MDPGDQNTEHMAEPARLAGSSKAARTGDAASTRTEGREQALNGFRKAMWALQAFIGVVDPTQQFENSVTFSTTIFIEWHSVSQNTILERAATAAAEATARKSTATTEAAAAAAPSRPR
jgi:hypothetical protein